MYPQDKAISIYHAIFSNHMSYGSQIWDQNENNALFKKIENLQRAMVQALSPFSNTLKYQN